MRVIENEKEGEGEKSGYDLSNGSSMKSYGDVDIVRDKYYI